MPLLYPFRPCRRVVHDVFAIFVGFDVRRRFDVVSVAGVVVYVVDFVFMVFVAVVAVDVVFVLVDVCLVFVVVLVVVWSCV